MCLRGTHYLTRGPNMPKQLLTFVRPIFPAPPQLLQSSALGQLLDDLVVHVLGHLPLRARFRRWSVVELWGWTCGPKRSGAFGSPMGSERGHPPPKDHPQQKQEVCEGPDVARCGPEVCEVPPFLCRVQGSSGRSESRLRSLHMINPGTLLRRLKILPTVLD